MKSVVSFFTLLAALAMPMNIDAAAINLREVAPGIYVHQGIHALPDKENRGEIANIGMIVGQHCVAVIDTGGSPEQGLALKRAIKAITTVPICYVINSHVHPDHIYGNSAFKEPGVHFVGHHKLPRAMAMRAPYYRDMATRDLGFTPGSDAFVEPDVPVESTLELELGGRILHLKAHQTAHTDSDLSVYDPQTKTLWLADLLFMEHLPVIDGSLNGWIKTIEELKQQPASKVIPGHGPISSAWPDAISAEERYLKMLQAELREQLRAGKTLEQAIATAGLSARGDWKLFDEFHRRNVSTAYAELEWEND